MSLELDDNIVWADASSLKPHPKNSNRHSQEQIERLSNIIKYQGWRQPIVVSKRSDFIVAGHGRLLAARALGLDKVPVSFQHFADETQELAYMISDNAIAAWATLDTEMIKNQLPDLSDGFDFDLLGLKKFNFLNNQTQELIDDAENEEKQKLFMLEVTFSSEADFTEIYQGLTSRGFIVRAK